MKNTTLNIAHRGAAGEAPENTLMAFETALKQNCDGIELDIQLSMDGEIMVCHDSTLDRTTNGSGRIIDLHSNQIRIFDAGSRYGKRFAGQRVPFLGEVLEMVPEHIMINIEIKMIPEYEHQIEPKLVQLLVAKQRFSNVVISSFDHECLVRIMMIAPFAKIGLLYSQKLINPAAYAESLGVPVFSLHPHYKSIREEDIKKAVSKGIAVYPWTVDRVSTMKRLIDKGVSGIITNYPRRMDSIHQS
jgi:glycerophosphoryl diester phosphodiesterase